MYIYISRQRSKAMCDTAHNITLLSSRRFEYIPFFMCKQLMVYILLYQSVFEIALRSFI